MEQHITPKLMVISDIHGSNSAFTAAMRRYKREKATGMLIAGDITARFSNSLALALNEFKSHITAVQGNCDTHWDQDILQFPIPVFRKIPFEGHTIFLTHGYHITPYHPPLLSSGDLFVSGHTHRPHLYLHEELNIFMLNPGSITTPRRGTPPSYGIITPQILEIRDLYQAKLISSLQYQNFS